ncbi:MAG: hypothetical protein J0H01_06495 [Rhizobiales bacterium]|nr:hypothetical protein [Hyphomicrobiales bacterium]
MQRHDDGTPIGGRDRYRAPAQMVLFSTLSLNRTDVDRSFSQHSQYVSFLDDIKRVRKLNKLESADTSLAWYERNGKYKEEVRYGLIAKLGARMLDWRTRDQEKAERSAQDKATAPSGYTYLGQFIAHDLSFSADRVPRATPAEQKPQAYDNLRQTLLSLESIYGGGPREFSLGYACPGRGEGRKPSSRTHLRVGAIRAKPAVDAGAAAREPETIAADLPRMSCPAFDGARTGMTDVLIADPRNDDHAIISQLTLLFFRLHNKIVDVIAADTVKIDNKDVHYYNLYERSRAVTTKVYRSIIVNDYLFTMLDRQIYERYRPKNAEAEVRFLTKRRPGQLAVEFSHAAFRFGHAMVRRDYPFRETFTIHEILKRNSADRPELMPFNSDWLVDWRNFFDDPSLRSTADQRSGDRSQLVLSRPLGPTFTSMEVPVVFLGDQEGKDGYPVLSIKVSKGGKAPADPEGLATRDLARSCSVPMASVEAIIGLMQEDDALGKIVGAHPLLADRSERERLIRDWLSADLPKGAGKVAFDGDLDFIVQHPPLLFFILLEAEIIGQGIRLGPLGSFIIAETMFSELASPIETPESPGRAGRRRIGYPMDYRHLLEPPEVVKNDLRAAFGTMEPKTMFDLIQYLEP